MYLSDAEGFHICKSYDVDCVGCHTHYLIGFFMARCLRLRTPLPPSLTLNAFAHLLALAWGSLAAAVWLDLPTRSHGRFELDIVNDNVIGKTPLFSQGTI